MKAQKFWEGRAGRLLGEAETLKGRVIGEYNAKGKHTGPELQHLAEVIQRLGICKILDVGSGSGMMATWLTQRGILPGLDYTCCDFVEAYIALHEQVTGLKPVKWDGVTLPFDDNSFDMVISYAVLLHVPPEDIVNHVAELVRVSRRWLYVHTAKVMVKWGGSDFLHNYYTLFATAGLHVSEEFISTDKKRVNWLLEKMAR